jgi:hypothetical protein
LFWVYNTKLFFCSSFAIQYCFWFSLLFFLARFLSFIFLVLYSYVLNSSFFSLFKHKSIYYLSSIMSFLVIPPYSVLHEAE